MWWPLAMSWCFCAFLGVTGTPACSDPITAADAAPTPSIRKTKAWRPATPAHNVYSRASRVNTHINYRRGSPNHGSTLAEKCMTQTVVYLVSSALKNVQKGEDAEYEPDFKFCLAPSYHLHRAGVAAEAATSKLSPRNKISSRLGDEGDNNTPLNVTPPILT
ncbi:hypothetical protein BJV78DRAFT_1155223 [Lactifluus subvellereus]|nr:hypothetical protein BJV78DRAFT_1155223 [Lactifluus subvellereus]